MCAKEYACIDFSALRMWVCVNIENEKRERMFEWMNQIYILVKQTAYIWFDVSSSKLKYINRPKAELNPNEW